MAKNLALHIPNPCHEDWQKMTPVEKGRFCDFCQKKVIDFSIMSDREVAQFFKRPSTGSVCGRFMLDQLDREIAIPKKRIPWLKYFFQIAIPSMLVSVKATAQGQVTVKATTVSIDQNLTPGKKAIADALVKEKKKLRQTTNEDLFNLVDPQPIAVVDNIGYDDNDENIIEGLVTDDQENPVSFATVMIKGTHKGVRAEENGHFSIAMRSDLQSLDLLVSAVGFEPKTVKVDRMDLKEVDMIVRLDPNNGVNENVTVHGYGTIRGMVIAGGVVSVVKNKKNESLVDSLRKWVLPAKPMLSLYPNPVRAGQTFTVAMKYQTDQDLHVSILAMDGRLVFSQAYTAVKAPTTFTITPDRRWAPGVYVVRIADKKKRHMVNAQLIIE